jgi:PAS domain S-box-containing protein
MVDKDKTLRGKLEGLFSDLPATPQPEPGPDALPIQAPRIAGETSALLRAVAEHTSDAIAISFVNPADVTQHKQAEETLARERSMLRTLIDNLPDVIYVKDTESRFLVANIAEARLMGAATPEELLGKSDADYFPAELATKYRADEQVILQSGQPLLNYEEPTVDLDGNPKWLINSKVPLRDRQGKVIGLVGMGRDITERKQAEAERERLAQDTRARAEREQMINAMIARVRAGLTVEQVLTATVEEIGSALGATRVAVRLNPASGSGAAYSGHGIEES